MPKASLPAVHSMAAQFARPSAIAGSVGYCTRPSSTTTAFAPELCTFLELRHDIKLCAAVAATWVGARRAAENVLAACGRCSWHARDAKRVQRSLFLNGHYGVRCFASRAHRVRCMGEGWPLQTWSTLWKRCYWSWWTSPGSGVRCGRCPWRARGVGVEHYHRHCQRAAWTPLRSCESSRV